ncbi:unnamed protein product [Spirodela intermedia]|uniref:Hexosyltransferase n=1 Tax=Spirodela intermedia TaxID=51605 RepID=A0A7I8IKC7_SPIIN|nr:unnamed protein product [Spirodela intermedia]CAA6658311.1 unnamed protein product [Spirodela intermedia]
MQVHVLQGRRQLRVIPGKAVRDFINMGVGSGRVSCRKVFYSLLLLLLLLRFSLFFMASDTIEGDAVCSTVGCVGERLAPKLWGRRLESTVVEEICRALEEEGSSEVEEEAGAAESMEEFAREMKSSNPDVSTFAVKLKAMVSRLERKARTAKIQGYLYRHVASSSIPKQLHCLSLSLADEYSSNAAARLQLPPPERVPALVDNGYRHFVLASDNVLAAAVVATSLVRSSVNPSLVVLHVVTDRKAFAAMHAWFSLHPPEPAVVEVKELHQFDWFARGKVPVLEIMEKDRAARAQFGGGSSAIVKAAAGEKPYVVAAKLQTLNPKYYSVMNHIRINLPELFPSLNKVVFLDDDVVIQADLSPLWEIDLHGKVNGAVETCRGDDSFVMSKRLKNYLNFSHPLISSTFDANQCAWAYGMNIFDLKAWRKTNITRTYNHWLQKNVESDLSLWQLGTLPPGLIAFHGHVHIIDPHWHMLGLGYQEKTSLEEVESAAVIHFNGRAKPWLDIAFPNLQRLWTKHVNFSDRFVRACDIRAT